mmetsp:Transcript_127374/g.354593  ORF Transcript_127374/g.354593 Transcript_127374/m.354593 type:complete len:305 (-) Transcript_127374:597-1511(-)
MKNASTPCANAATARTMMYFSSVLWSQLLASSSGFSPSRSMGPKAHNNLPAAQMAANAEARNSVGNASTFIIDRHVPIGPYVSLKRSTMESTQPGPRRTFGNANAVRAADAMKLQLTMSARTPMHTNRSPINSPSKGEILANMFSAVGDNDWRVRVISKRSLQRYADPETKKLLAASMSVRTTSTSAYCRTRSRHDGHWFFQERMACLRLMAVPRCWLSVITSGAREPPCCGLLFHAAISCKALLHSSHLPVVARNMGLSWRSQTSGRAAKAGIPMKRQSPRQLSESFSPKCGINHWMPTASST